MNNGKKPVLALLSAYYSLQVFFLIQYEIIEPPSLWVQFLIVDGAIVALMGWSLILVSSWKEKPET